MKKKILAVAAHPDDLDITCGGTIAKLASQGNEIFYLIISDGSKGTHRVKLSAKKMIEIREKEAKEVAAVLGVKRVLFLRAKDGEIENTPALRKKIVRIIRKTKPEMILSFDPANNQFDSFHRFHRDHRMTAELVFDSVFPAAGNFSFFPELLKEGYLPHKVKEMWFFGTAKPNKYIDIGREIDIKIKAVSKYLSQVNPEEIEKKIRAWAVKFGKGKGYKYGEPFRIIKLD